MGVCINYYSFPSEPSYHLDSLRKATSEILCELLHSREKIAGSHLSLEEPLATELLLSTLLLYMAYVGKGVREDKQNDEEPVCFSDKYMCMMLASGMDLIEEKLLSVSETTPAWSHAKAFFSMSETRRQTAWDQLLCLLLAYMDSNPFA